METSPYQTRFKNLEGKPERESPKRTISTSSGFGLLQMVLEPDTGQYASKDAGPWRRERMPMRTLGPEWGWNVRSHISWRGERNILYKGVETSSYQTRFKNLEGKPERESPKRTISTSSGLRLLQMVSEPDTGQCANKDAGPQRRERMPTRTLGSKWGWNVRSHIGWRGEQNILYKGVETSSYQTRFKNFKGKLERESKKKNNIG